MTPTTTSPKTTPAKQLEAFMAKYDRPIALQAKKALTAVRKRCPGAIEMVYDNYNGLVIGFAPNERPSDAIFSILLQPKHITLCFLQGARLPDPDKLLAGAGTTVRHIRLIPPEILNDPKVIDLMDRAKARATVRFDPKTKRQLIIKSISAKQRPRRPA